MIEKFKEGYLYRIPSGITFRPRSFNSAGGMDFMMSGDWFKCVKGGRSFGDPCVAKFESVKTEKFYPGADFSVAWDWDSVMNVMEESSNTLEGKQFLLEL